MIPPKDTATRGRVSRFSAVLFLTLLVGTAALAEAQEGTYSELPNFHRVSASLYRGGQPGPGGIARLASLGFNTIISLRQSNEGTRSDEAESRARGLRYYSVPLSQFDRPEREQISRILALIADPMNGKVFVHCHYGRDRTGTVIACYRIAHDGWSSAEAKSEAKRHGLSMLQFRMKDFISDFASERVEKRAKTSRRAESPGIRRPGGDSVQRSAE
jgi:tyrosine-protein phosphatase SIW14